MKALVTLVALLVAGTASAKDFSAMSWAQILNNPKYKVANVNVDFQDQGVQVDLWNASLCTDGEMIYGEMWTITWLDDDQTRRGPNKKVLLSQEIVSEKAMVVPGSVDNNLQWYNVTYVQSPVVELAIYGASSIDDDGKTNAFSYLGSKTYRIPRCDLPPVDNN